MNMNKVDKNDAPKGYIAKRSKKGDGPCSGCVPYLSNACMNSDCSAIFRKDCCDVIFVKKKPKLTLLEQVRIARKERDVACKKYHKLMNKVTQKRLTT